MSQLSGFSEVGYYYHNGSTELYFKKKVFDLLKNTLANHAILNFRLSATNSVIVFTSVNVIVHYSGVTKRW